MQYFITVYDKTRIPINKKAINPSAIPIISVCNIIYSFNSRAKIVELTYYTAKIVIKDAKNIA